MQIILPTQGLNDSLEAFVNRTPTSDFILRLFTNDVTPTAASVSADFTEASGSGYAEVTMNNWDAAISGEPATISHPTVTFTFTASHAPIYGFFATRSGVGSLGFAARFDNAPISVPGATTTIEVDATLGEIVNNG